MNTLFCGLEPWRRRLAHRARQLAPTQRFGAAGLLAIIAAFLLVAPAVQAVDPPPDGRHFDLITVGGVKYTKVTVIDIAPRHVSFRSAQGFSTVLISELEPEVRAKLGRGDLDLSDAYRNKSGTTAKDGSLGVKARESKGKGPQDGTDAKAGGSEDEDEEEADDSCSAGGFFDQNVEWTFKNIAAAGTVCLGLLAMFAAHCWFIGVAFRTSVGWGLAVLIGTFFAGILNWVFCCTHWSVAKRPVYLNIAGFVLIFVGIISFGK